MEYLEFEVGDKCWIHGAAGPENPLTEAKVVHKFHLDGWLTKCHYVCQVETSIDPVLYVRDGTSMSDSPDNPIGLWRKLGRNKSTEEI